MNDGTGALELFFGKAGEKVPITVDSLSIFVHYLCIWCFLKFKSIVLVLHLGVLYHSNIGKFILKLNPQKSEFNTVE